MIKFFRNIRRTLLEENKTRKYLTYAIGEIILVVIGILIALQLNNLNELRKSSIQEQKYLQSLKLDLETDLVNLDAMIEDCNKKVSASMALLNLKPPTTTNELMVCDSMLWNVYRWTRFSPRTNTIDELISSGNLNIIQNDSIKFYLLNIKQKNEKILVQREHVRREYEHYIYDRAFTIRPISPYLNMTRTVEEFELIRDTKLSHEETMLIAKQTKVLLDDLAMQNGLKLSIFNNTGLRRKYEEMAVEIEIILSHISAELGN